MIERGPSHFILFRDEAGDWCAAPPNFVDLVVHPTGLGRTAEDAIIELLRQPEFHDRALKGEWSIPRAVDFIEVPEPDGAKMSVGYDLETKLPRIVFGGDAVAEQRRAAFKIISNDSPAGPRRAEKHSDYVFIP
jgi:hypothetical protein